MGRAFAGVSACVSESWGWARARQSSGTGSPGNPKGGVGPRWTADTHPALDRRVVHTNAVYTRCVVCAGLRTGKQECQDQAQAAGPSSRKVHRQTCL